LAWHDPALHPALVSTGSTSFVKLIGRDGAGSRAAFVVLGSAQLMPAPPTSSPKTIETKSAKTPQSPRQIEGSQRATATFRANRRVVLAVGFTAMVWQTIFMVRFRFGTGARNSKLASSLPLATSS
jgi:hypothetical protein